MNKIQKWRSGITYFIIHNIPITIFFLIIIFVGVIALMKLSFSEPETVYARVKVSQGLWWANTAKPTIWMVQSLKKGDVEKSLSGKPAVEVLEVRSYPWWSTEQYDIYLTVKLDADLNEKTGKYTFKRSTLSVGAPVDFEFPGIMLSGTVMVISDEPFENEYLEKTITLKKNFVLPWEAEAIQVGDSYSDGEEMVFEVLETNVVPAHEIYSSVGNNYPIDTEKRVNIEVVARIKVREQQGILVFREEQPLQLGRVLNIQTRNIVFNDFTISAIE